MRCSILAVGFLSVLVACETQTTAPDAVEVRLAKAPAADTHSRVNLIWADSVVVNAQTVAAGIRGDGRDRFGQLASPANEYQGDFCGVRGFIYDLRGESGNLEADPDTYYSSTMSSVCGSSRKMAFYLTGQSAPPTTASPHILGTAIWNLTPSQTKLVAQRFGMQLTTTCGELDFNAQYAGASNARISRLPDAIDAGGRTVRVWRLESQGNHIAACVKMQQNGKFVDSGIRYYLPFAVVITQVPYPYPKFP